MIARDPRKQMLAMTALSILTGGLPLRVVEAVEATAKKAFKPQQPAPNPVPRVNDPKLAKYLRTSKLYKRGAGAKGK